MKSERKQVAHLFRRAGFGATPSELDTLTETKSYEDIVDDLVNPERCENIDDSFVERYYFGEGVPNYVGKWLFKMVNTERPLEEKMALFLHHIFPVAWGKSEHGPSIFDQIDMFKRVGLTDFRNILVELSKDPAMIYWLDNNENHKNEINENYGRELLELFSMGVGNYTEDDIKSASRAFTGWTFSQPIPLYPQGNYPSRFEFHPEDHDCDEKTFLGHKGAFDGEDIIDIIVKENATARFVSRHLCNFFVEDEPQVPAWNIEAPRDPGLVDHLAKTFLDSGADMRVVLKELLNSDSFKDSIKKSKVKSPTELVAGVLKQVGTCREIRPGLESYVGSLTVMGQSLLNPPTVEGWHTGPEWIDSGTLSERINFAASEFLDDESPGMTDLIRRVGSLSDEPNELIEPCLDLLGGVQISSTTRSELVRYISEIRITEGESNLTDLIRMIVSTVDYQYA